MTRLLYSLATLGRTGNTLLSSKMVLRAWNMFQEKAADRKAALMSSNDHHNFMGMDRDLVFWIVEKSDYLRESIRRCFGSNADHDNLKKPS